MCCRDPSTPRSRRRRRRRAWSFRRYACLLASFHGDSDGRTAAPVLAAPYALVREHFPRHLLLLGVDANTVAAHRDELPRRSPRTPPRPSPALHQGGGRTRPRLTVGPCGGGAERGGAAGHAGRAGARVRVRVVLGRAGRAVRGVDLQHADAAAAAGASHLSLSASLAGRAPCRDWRGRPGGVGGVASRRGWRGRGRPGGVGGDSGSRSRALQRCRCALQRCSEGPVPLAQGGGAPGVQSPQACSHLCARARAPRGRWAVGDRSGRN
jgi:hypothetical protein